MHYSTGAEGFRDGIDLPLTDKNWISFAWSCYYNPQCIDEQEFFDDLKRIKYLKKSISRFEMNGELKERLILNHLIILNNVFGPVALPRILLLKMRDQLRFLRPFLELISCWPDDIVVGEPPLSTPTEIFEPDPVIVAAVRAI